ncbi:hypothetical protein [Streptomyces huasconensis]|uniref:hypothetical protein n=1 Tax=Streptomyces huasconensis TaxID=1854574 RepID=UPI0033DB1FB2
MTGASAACYSTGAFAWAAGFTVSAVPVKAKMIPAAVKDFLGKRPNGFMRSPGVDFQWNGFREVAAAVDIS